MTEVSQDDVHAAKDAIIQMLTNALIRSQAELSALRREGNDGSDSPDPPVQR